MAAIEAHPIWGGMVTYSDAVTNQHVDAYHNWTNNVENYRDNSAIVFWSYMPEIQGTAIMTAYEDLLGRENSEGLAEFMGIPEQLASTMRMDSHKNLAVEIQLPSGYR